MKIPKLGRKKSNREHLLVNLAISLILAEQITTTLPKAKILKSFAEKLIFRAQQNDLATRRFLLAKLDGNKLAVKKLIEELGVRFKDQKSGFVRIVKGGRRAGDNAPLAQVMLTKKIEDVISNKKEQDDQTN